MNVIALILFVCLLLSGFYSMFECANAMAFGKTSIHQIYGAIWFVAACVSFGSCGIIAISASVDNHLKWIEKNTRLKEEEPISLTEEVS